jgi:mannose-6-phosphate isomerase-like protein (cupin superfamily)
MMATINLDQKFGLFDEQWRAQGDRGNELPGAQTGQGPGRTSLARREQEDEFWSGRANFASNFVTTLSRLGPGECVVVPRGVEHRTCADDEARAIPSI